MKCTEMIYFIMMNLFKMNRIRQLIFWPDYSNIDDLKGVRRSLRKGSALYLIHIPIKFYQCRRAIYAKLRILYER